MAPWRLVRRLPPPPSARSVREYPTSTPAAGRVYQAAARLAAVEVLSPGTTSCAETRGAAASTPMMSMSPDGPMAPLR